MYLDSSVSFECFSSRKDFLWFLYRTLNSLDDIPIYLFVSALSVVVTSALYTNSYIYIYIWKYVGNWSFKL